MNAPPFNGDDDRSHPSTQGDPEPWKCLDCPAGGTGYVSRGKHWYATGQGHHIVWGLDPRAKKAPRASADPQPEPQCMVNDGQGRR